MPEIKHSIIYLLAGIGLVTLIDVIGSIVSRRLKFNYGYFTILSIIAYTWVSYSVSKNAGSLFTSSTIFLVGIYDVTVGWMICQKLRAYYPIPEEIKNKLTFQYRMLAMIPFIIVCGLIGIWLA